MNRRNTNRRNPKRACLFLAELIGLLGLLVAAYTILIFADALVNARAEPEQRCFKTYSQQTDYCREQRQWEID